jgi:N4-gp56 family major capsid protein
MASTSNTTLLSDLLDPQVVADEIKLKLIPNIRFAPLATIDYSLTGRDGDELTYPFYPYAGDADVVAEGADIPITKLEQGTKKVKVFKIGKGIEYTDEALLSGNANNVANEAVRQITASVASGVDNKFLAEMKKAVLHADIPSSGNIANAIIDGVAQFGEEIDGGKVLLIPSDLFARITKSNEWIQNTERGADILISGSVGQIAGCQVVISDRLKAQYSYELTTDVTVDSSKTYFAKTAEGRYYPVENPVDADLDTYYERTKVSDPSAFIVKQGALRLVMKRDFLVEFDRDIIDQTNVVTGSSIFAPYLFDENKIVKLNIQ